MPSRLEAKQRLIRDFRTKVDELQGLLQTYLSGEGRTFGQGWTETTENDIVQLEREIAALEETIARVEKQVSDA
jgi:hypothetical protein